MTSLDADRLKSILADCGLMDVVIHTSLPSTNDWALQQSREGRAIPFACFAEAQTAGRGRRGKVWQMSPGSNIAMSLCWHFDSAKKPLYLLALTSALAIVTTLENAGLKQVQIKWPNDVYVRGKKIAGILIETRPVKDSLVAVVIGIGLNYDMDIDSLSFSKDDQMSLTDICQEMGVSADMPGKMKDTNLTEVASDLLLNVIAVCKNYPQDYENNLERFRTHYDYCKNKTVEVTGDDQVTVSGLAQGVNERAELVVSIDGEDRTFNSAEVSVRAVQVNQAS